MGLKILAFNLLEFLGIIKRYYIKCIIEHETPQLDTQEMEVDLFLSIRKLNFKELRKAIEKVEKQKVGNIYIKNIVRL